MFQKYIDYKKDNSKTELNDCLRPFEILKSINGAAKTIQMTNRGAPENQHDILDALDNDDIVVERSNLPALQSMEPQIGHK